MAEAQPLPISGARMTVTYRLQGSERDAWIGARAIAREQTVEFPEHLIPTEAIRDQVMGRVEDLSPLGADTWAATLTFADETTGGELPQLLNVLFGNISLWPGVRLERLQLSGAMLSRFAGPRFGRSGLRRLLGVENRALLCTALKPMGLSARELAHLAYQFAAGGIDLIKDDHGLANQPFAAWQDRVEACAAAVQRANEQTGGHARYLASVTAPADQVAERAHAARRLGAGGLLIIPGLVGWDTMRSLADDESLALPIMSHPAWLGSLVANPGHGIAHGVLFGQLMRLAGADAVIYPNYGGRFSFSPDECRDIVRGTERAMGLLKAAFPTPGGGMTLDRVPEMVAAYGPEVILLIGGGLFAEGPDLQAASRRFLELLDRRAAP